MTWGAKFARDFIANALTFSAITTDQNKPLGPRLCEDARNRGPKTLGCARYDGNFSVNTVHPMTS